MAFQTVLVVDDESGPRESLRMLLTPNHEVLTSSNGANSLEILRTEKVDVVTLDLNMPGIGGEELMRTIHAEHPQVEIIVITGCASLASAQEGIRHGICDYLQKPFDVVQVTAAVNRALTRGGARRGTAPIIFMAMVSRSISTRFCDGAIYRSPAAIACRTVPARISSSAALIVVSCGLSAVQPSAATWPGGVTVSSW